MVQLEEWDGSSWAAQSTLSVPRVSAGSAGGNGATGALCIGGALSPWAVTDTVELWTKSATVRSVDTT